MAQQLDPSAPATPLRGVAVSPSAQLHSSWLQWKFLSLPLIFNVNVRTGDLNGAEAVNQKRLYSYLGDFSLGFRDYLFLLNYF